MGWKIKEAKESWIDEEGGKVEILNCVSQVYIDFDSKDLSEKYDLSSYNGYSLLFSLGKNEYEEAATKILGLCKIFGEVVGVEREELEKYLSGVESSLKYSVSHLADKNYLRAKKIKGLEVLFSTEKLLYNQWIGRKNNFNF